MLTGVIVHPRRTLGEAASRPRLGRGTAGVVVTGTLSLGLGLLASRLGRGGAAADILSLASPAMLVLFWLVSALLVSAGVRLMGVPPRRREMLAVSGLTYPPLVAYALITLLQAVASRFGADGVALAAGLLALPVVCWFVVLNAVAVQAVYSLPSLSAAAIALLPYAALSAVLLLLIVVLSVLHAAGAI